jgi:Domain of Unknown Function (DUF1080)
MHKLPLVLLAALLCSHTPKKDHASVPPVKKDKADEWITLFDGKTTNGWHTYGKSSAGKIWKVEDGALHADASVRKDMPNEGGDLTTNEEFENFDLKLEWKISEKGNSGVILFVHEAPEFEESWNTGPEIQVLDNGTPTRLGHPDAKLYTHRAGDLYDLLASKEAVKPQGQWNQVEIVANKGKLDLFMNGQHTLTTTMWDENWKKMIAISKFKDMPSFGTYQKGKIALQDHGNDVWYRNIRIRKL